MCKTKINYIKKKEICLSRQETELKFESTNYNLALDF